MSESGLTISQIAAATSRTPAELRLILDAELLAGRVVRDDAGCFSLVADAFDGGTLLALLAIHAVSDDAGGSRWEPAKRPRSGRDDSQYVQSAPDVTEALTAREDLT
jgi:hypothetical protein